MAAPTAPQQANPTATAVATFLQYARTRAYPTLSGSIPLGSAGGSSSSQVAWIPADIPDVAAYCEEIDLYCTLPITLTLPANCTEPLHVPAIAMPTLAAFEGSW